MSSHNDGKEYENIAKIALLPCYHIAGRDLPHYPYIGKREILCGPYFQNKETPIRKFIRTSELNFDINEVLSQLNDADKEISLIVVILQASPVSFPKNLSKLKCPKLAIVCDTHHILYPISTLLEYMKREKFEHILAASQPAHLHFFYEIGIKHLAMDPYLKVHFRDVNNKKPGITYIGHRWSSSHPRRSRLVQFLEKKLPKNNIPYHYYQRLPEKVWKKVLNHSKMVVISSLNGQFTPQIYTCLSAGALCFVDELSPQTLLYNFFKPGKHLITWRSFDDLLEKIIYYHNHPLEAEAISKTGKLKAQNSFTNAEVRAPIFSDFVFHNKIDPRFLGTNDRRCQYKRVEDPNLFNARVRLYENIQDLHLIHENLNLISMTQKNLNPSIDLADLPRLNITHCFSTEKLKKQADLYFQRVGVDEKIETTIFNKSLKLRTFDIGILESKKNQNLWRFYIKSISSVLKFNSVLWIFGDLTTKHKVILKKHRFRPYPFPKKQVFLKIKDYSRKICFLTWKLGLFPFPYLTLKPRMETVPYLNVYLRGWQSILPLLY